ncbi:MAG: 16S rRNA processing protein RimM [Anaerolineae bacterium]|nr:16S rRNA processing protein RimM [Anaerolineae bacterium]
MGTPNGEHDVNERGSGPPPRPTEPRFLAVGRVSRPHGIRGELRMEILTDFPERLSRHPLLYLGPQNQPYPLEGVRFHKTAALIKLAGCDDRTAAEKLRGQLVQIPAAVAVPLEEGEYYHFQVVGLEVFSSEGEKLGRVVDLLETGANDVYVVHGPRGELLIPAIEAVVQELDLQARRMVVVLMAGLIE